MQFSNARITKRDRKVIGISLLFLCLCFTLDSTPCIVHSAFPLGSKSISQFPLLFESFAQQQRKRKAFQSTGKHAYKLTNIDRKTQRQMSIRNYNSGEANTVGMCRAQGGGSGGICPLRYLPTTGIVHGVTRFGEVNPSPTFVSRTGGIFADF